jgi:hypothetical protein
MKIASDKAADAEEPLVRQGTDFAAHDGKRVTAAGRYQSVVAPQKGAAAPDVPKDRALLVLEDGTEIFLEPMDSPKALRSAAERRQLEGKKIHATGTAHRIMPSRGESVIAPCLSDVSAVLEA